MKKVEFVLTSKHNQKRFLGDATWKNHVDKKPVILLIHGFKGFKDWGCFNMIAEHYAELGYAVVKSNTAFDGTTLDMPFEITDFDAFAENNFSKELDDIGTTIDWIFDSQCPIPNLDLDKVFLIGHSRGGGMALLKAAEDSRIKKVATWASIPSVDKFFSEDFLIEWKIKGIAHVVNGRNGDNLPLHYQIVEDFNQNKDRLDVGKAIASLAIPTLLIHGDVDETVPVAAAQYLNEIKPDSDVLIIEGGSHTFGSKHPWEATSLPVHMQQVVDATEKFFIHHH
ncbi:dienelactone hydrolase family protein [Limibacter armeniacum]|uniref:alpha/beta hydrolase family protein n=1 Tax=Limibacter armeniacum TaxID=466084 RepID=UPI002FE563BB